MNKSFIKHNFVELLWCTLILFLNLKDDDFWFLVPVFCILTMLILRPSQFLGLLASAIFMLASILLLIAWISELNEFHTINHPASALFAGGAGILILMLSSAVLLFKKYVKSNFIHTRLLWK